MKTILIVIGLLLSSFAFGQLDTVNNGTAPGSGNGEILYTAFQKVNRAIVQLNDTIDADSVIFNYKLGVLTDGIPTEAEINSVLGSPGSKSPGWTARIKDTDGTGLVYYLVTDGVNWYWTSSTTAL